MAKVDGLNVNYGCGLSVAEGWINFDASPTLRLARLPLIGAIARKRTPFPSLARYGDVTRGLPISTVSADRVYCSHVIEHLSYEDALKAFRETFRIMRPGAAFRGVMPDLRIEVQRYLDNERVDAAHEFMRSTLLGEESRPRGIKGLAVSFFGNSEHRWLWDISSLEFELTKVGFVEVRQAEFADYQDEQFAAVEHEGRWENCLGWSCVKP